MDMNPWFLWGLITFGGLNAADATTTEIALRRQGVVEANPILRGPVWRRLAIKGAGAAGAIYLQKKLYDSGHTKLATVVTWSFNGVYAGVVIRNVRVIHRADNR